MSDNQSSDGEKATSRKPSLIANLVRDGKDDQSYWSQIGAAWSNKDGGFTLQLYATPLDGRVVLTRPKAKS